MPLNETVSNTCTFVAYICLGSSLFMWGRISGIEKGYLYGVFQSHPSSNGFGWFIDHYQEFNNWYFYITAGFGIYIIGKLFKPAFVSSVICLFALAVAFQQHLDMLIFRCYKLDYAARVSDNVWIQNAPYFHFLLLALIVVLLAVEFFLMNGRKSESVILRTDT